MLELRILGPMEVRWDGRPLALPGSASRRVLAVLLLRAGEWVSTDRLIDELWSERPPASARKALQMHVSRLRHALAAAGPDGAHVLASGPAGYRLDVAAEQVDAARFERSVSDARAALAASEPERARELLVGALGLWRGRPLADLSLDGAPAAELGRLEELRLAALELRIDADLQLGRHLEVIGELQRAATEHPWRERLHAQLMLALYRAGRQADALEAYRRARDVLVEQLGIEPGRELRELQQAILVHDAGLDPARTTAEPAPRGQTRLAVPRERPHAALLERERELEEIEVRLERAREGTGAVLMLDGPPGIGKTALLRAGRDIAQARGMRVLRARGAELEREFAYGVARQLFESALVRATPQERASLLEGAAALAAPVVGLAAERGRPASGFVAPGDALFSSLHGLYWLAANLAERAPLLLVVDDAHWADVASLRFLGYLAGRIEELPVVVMAAARSAEPGAELHLVAALRSDPLSTSLAPAPLSEGAVAQLVRSAFAREGAHEFCAACRAATAGNPLLLRELLSTLVVEGVAPEAIHVPLVRRLGAESVADAVLTRLLRLPAGAVRLAQAVAVLGGGELRHAAALADLDERAAAETADMLVAAGVLTPAQPLQFTHPLVRGALYERIPSGERAHSHLRAARLLAAEGADADRIATQLLPAAPVGDPWVVDTLRDTATAAISGGAPEVAVTHLRRALAEPPPKSLRGEVLLELGAAEFRAGDPAAVEHLEKVFQATNDRPVWISAAWALSRSQAYVDTASARLIEVLKRARARAAEKDLDLRLELECALVSVAAHAPATAATGAEQTDRLDALAREAEDPSRNVLAQLAFSALLRNRPAARVVQLAERALARKSAAIAPDQPFGRITTALILAERFDRARSLLDELLAGARTMSRGQPTIGALSALRALIAYRCGAAAEAELDASIGIEIVRANPHGFMLASALSALLEPLVERGELDRAEREIERSGIERQEPVFFHSAWYLHARGRLRIAQERWTEGVDDFLRCGQILARARGVNPAIAPWRSEAALVHHHLGDRAQAGRLADEELELARAFGAPRALGIALRAAGLVEGGDPGIELLRESVSVLEGSLARIELARALTDLGAALRGANRTAEAREPLRRGLELAYRCGATMLARRARDELQAAGVRPRRPVLRGVDALTARERRIAELAADRMTSRQIAQALFVSIQTVESHLSDVYEKLDITSRQELGPVLGLSTAART